MQQWPKLLFEDAIGNLREWNILAYQDESGTYIKESYGLWGADLSENRISTLSYESALKQAETRFKNKLASGYYPEDKKESKIWIPSPMLAKRFDKEKDKVKYPVLVQPKLDGIRCLLQRQGDEIIAWTRRGKVIQTIPWKDDALNFLQDGEMLDGELYKHLERFENISSQVRNEAKGYADLEFFIYDFIQPEELPQLIRIQEFLDRVFPGKKITSETIKVTNNLNLLEFWKAEEENQVHELHAAFVQRGFEGAMVKNLAGTYRQRYRSRDWLKVKVFEDAEFKIVGYTSGDGVEKDCIIYTCETPEGRIFNCRPQGTFETRRALFQKGDFLIGKYLTVRFFGWGNKGLPRFPVGISIREDL